MALVGVGAVLSLVGARHDSAVGRYLRFDTVVAALVLAAAALVLAGRGAAAITALTALLVLPVGAARAARHARRAASEALRRDLADALELIAVGLASGAPLARALAAAAAYVPPPLGPVLARAARASTAASGPSLAAALRREDATLGGLAALVGAAEELGTPLGEAVAALAADERERARTVTRIRAAEAGPKMMLVVGLLLAPAALLLVIGGEALLLVQTAGDIAP